MPNETNGQPRGATTDPDAYRDEYGRLQAALFKRWGLAARTRYVEVDGLPGRVHLFEAGAGEAIVFLHGGAGIGAEHIPVVARLATKFHVIVPDRPGHGLSDDFDYGREDLRASNVAFVGALLNSLGLERVALVGNSYGGFMSLNFALAHPERVAHLVHLGFSPGLVNRHLPVMMRLMVTPVIGTVLGATVARPSDKNTRMFFGKLIVAHIDRMPDELVRLETMHSRRHGKSIASLFRAGITSGGFRQRYVMRDELPKIRVPATFLWGERDPFMPLGEARTAASLVPGAAFEVIPDAGHMPCTDQPDVTASLVAAAIGKPRRAEVAIGRKVAPNSIAGTA